LESSGAEGTFGKVDDSKALAQIWKKHGKIFGSKDVGLLVTTFLMNLIQLKPGQGCWILAGELSKGSHIYDSQSANSINR